MLIGSVTGLYSGRVEEIATANGKIFKSGIRKKPIERARVVDHGLIDDEGEEPAHHTSDKAVHFFSHDVYPDIEAQLGSALSQPSFGENFSTSGLKDTDICVGDQLKIGDVLLEVTQPAQRCRTVGLSLGKPKILKVLHDLELCGFYARVLEQGDVWVDCPVTLEKRVQDQWTIHRIHRVMFKQLGDQNLIDAAFALTELSDEWKERALVMQGRLKRGEPMSSTLAGLKDL